MAAVPEREITEPVDLCLPDGRLNPEAVGWSRRPLHRTTVPGWGRGKRWEYWGLVTPTHVVGLTVSSIDYAGVESVYVLDRVSGTESTTEAVLPLARGVELPERSGVGRAAVTTRHLRIEMAEEADGTRIRARTAALRARRRRRPRRGRRVPGRRGALERSPVPVHRQGRRSAD